MHLSEVYVENFRVFGSSKDDQHLCLSLRPGLNVIVGENDSGKSAIIDAIRYVLWTTSLEYHRLTEDDFHVMGSEHAEDLTLRCRFSDLSRQEQARFLEWLSIEDGDQCLYITLKAAWVGDESAGRERRRRIAVRVRSGKTGEGLPVEGEMREFLRTTYLRPLRDAEAELSAGRGSRLSQILQSHPNFGTQEVDNFDENDPVFEPSTLAEILHRADYEIQCNDFIVGARNDLNDRYLREFSVGDDVLEGEIGVARRTELRYILEKLELWLRSRPGIDIRTRRGLGVNNVLFMATELLLLAGEDHEALPLLLIEEPEAHLHPQLQLRLMEFLQVRSREETARAVQVIVTTHSPNLASVVNLERITLMHQGRAYSLAQECTCLAPLDYRFLERFLDVTKANLFFAKGVVIVEGDAENILLPALAKCVGHPFSEHGISIVNVGSRALFRYSRIFQRKDGKDIPIRVACIADRDVVPDEADYEGNRRRESEYSNNEIEELEDSLRAEDTDNVQTFVSGKWTLEYDLAYFGFKRRLDYAVHLAIQLARKSKNKQKSSNPGCLTDEEIAEIRREAWQTLKEWKVDGLDKREIAARIYEPLAKNYASKAETAQFLAEFLENLDISPVKMRTRLPSYLVAAIDHVTKNVEVS